MSRTPDLRLCRRAPRKALFEAMRSGLVECGLIERAGSGFRLTPLGDAHAAGIIHELRAGEDGAPRTYPMEGAA